MWRQNDLELNKFTTTGVEALLNRANLSKDAILPISCGSFTTSYYVSVIDWTIECIESDLAQGRLELLTELCKTFPKIIVCSSWVATAAACMHFYHTEIHFGVHLYNKDAAQVLLASKHNQITCLVWRRLPNRSVWRRSTTQTRTCVGAARIHAFDETLRSFCVPVRCYELAR